MSELTHPRDTYAFDGGEAAELAFLSALERGRLHHAWLLVGPEGVGKATFAYRAARRLLGAKPEERLGPLGAHPEDPVCRQIAARAHPDLLVLERETDDGKVRKSIPVEEARKLPDFFALSPGEAKYRVAIVDAADDLNVNAANALLKTLEEPPERGVLFLVSHTPGALLATIRSRCRRLAFAPPPEDEAVKRVQARADLNAEDAIRLVRMARGAPGRALKLADSGGIAMDDAAREILLSLPKIDYGAMTRLTDSFRGAEGQERFRLLIDRLAARAHTLAADRALEGRTAGLDRWAQVWERLSTLPDEVEAVNLDRADALWTALGELKAVA